MPLKALNWTLQNLKFKLKSIFLTSDGIVLTANLCENVIRTCVIRFDSTCSELISTFQMRFSKQLSLVLIATHWHPLAFINSHWLSLIYINLHWLSLIPVDHSWFTNRALRWLRSMPSLTRWKNFCLLIAPCTIQNISVCDPIWITSASPNSLGKARCMPLCARLLLHTFLNWRI